MEQASTLVNRPALQRLDDETQRIRHLYQVVYQREPEAEEIQLGLRFLHAKAATADLKGQSHAQRPLDPWERYGQVLLMSNELMFVD